MDYLRPLLASPQLAGLHTLSLNLIRSRWTFDVPLGEPETPDCLLRLRRLLLSNTSVSNASIARLGKWPQAARLTTLDLAGTGFNAPNLAVLFSNPHLTELQHLNLARNHVGDSGAQILAESPRLSRLRSLNCDGNYLTIQGCRLLATSPSLGQLKILSLCDIGLEDDQVLERVETPLLQRLDWLRLSAQRFSPEIQEQLRERFGERV